MKNKAYNNKNNIKYKSRLNKETNILCWNKDWNIMYFGKIKKECMIKMINLNWR
jgi:hypothetical protein